MFLDTKTEDHAFEVRHRGLYTAIARHTVLVCTALAACAVTAALVRDHAGSKHPNQSTRTPPADPGLIPFTYPERLIAGTATLRPPGHTNHWVNWHGARQARSRWSHKRAGLARNIEITQVSWCGDHKCSPGYVTAPADRRSLDLVPRYPYHRLVTAQDDPIDPDDIMVVIDHPFGAVDVSLADWIVRGPGGRSLLRPVRAWSRSTRQGVPLSSIPLRYRNDEESRQAIRDGLIDNPWPDVSPVDYPPPPVRGDRT